MSFLSPLRLHASLSSLKTWNALLTYADKPLAVGDGSVRVTFSLSPQPNGDPFCALLATQTGLPLLVVARSYPFKPLHGVEVVLDNLPFLPAVLTTALMEGIIARVASVLPDGIARAGSITKVGRISTFDADPALSQTEWFDLHLEGLAPEPVELSVGGPLMELASRIFAKELVPNGVSKGLSRVISITAHFTLAQMVFSTGGLSDLSAGDVLVLDEGASLSLRVMNRLYALRSEAQNVSIAAVKDIHDSQTQMEPVKMAADDHQDGGVPLNIARLPVRVDVDVGSIDVTFADLESWRAGTVVPLAVPALESGLAVTLSVGNQMIAAGDLIRIDDRIAVRLTRISGPA